MHEQRIITLIRNARNEDREAFGELVSEFEPSVFGIVLRRLRNRSEAHEVTQDVFMQAMRKLPQLREPARFSGWLRQIAVRMSINRAVRRPNETSFSPDAHQSANSEPQTPLDNLLRREESRQVWGGLNRLREMDRQTLVAFYFRGRSLKEMSNDFERPIGTIKRRLHTARNRLRDELVQMSPV